MPHFLRKDALKDCFFYDVELVVTIFSCLQILGVVIRLQRIDILLFFITHPTLRNELLLLLVLPALSLILLELHEIVRLGLYLLVDGLFWGLALLVALLLLDELSVERG